MTYRQLLEYLQTLNLEQLNQDVTVQDSAIKEFYPVSCTSVALETNDVLDAGHVYLVFK